MPNVKHWYSNFFCLSTSKRSYTVFLCVVQYHHNSDVINHFQLSQPGQDWVCLHLHCSSWFPWITNTSAQAKWSKEFPSLKVTSKLSIPKSKEWMAYLKISQHWKSFPYPPQLSLFLLRTPAPPPDYSHLPYSIPTSHPTATPLIQHHAAHLLLNPVHHFAAHC